MVRRNGRTVEGTEQMKEQMDRDTLLYKICPWDRINGCYNGTRDYQCYDCVQLMNKWLDEYDKQIRAKAIDDAKSVILQTLDNEILVDTLHLRLEQLKEQKK